VNDNTRLTAHVTVIREDGAVLYSKLAQQSYDFGDNVDEVERYAARCERWLEAIPSPDFDPSVFARREVDGDDLLRIIDGMLRPEQRGTLFDLEGAS